MKSQLTDLLKNSPVITDGAWGTQMQEKGLGAGECADGWNLTHPERVEEVALSYVEAGSRIILTNTFRSNRIALEQYGLGEKTGAINRAGVEISKRAAGNRALVFASMGPSGKMLFMEEVSAEKLLTVFEEQARALAEAGADGIVIETMSDVEEARLALSAALKTGLPVVASMVFDSGRDKDRTMMGLTPEQVAEELTASGADVIGANCGQGIEGFVSLCERLKSATDLPVWIKSNAGLPEVVDGKIFYRMQPDRFAHYAGLIKDKGASFIGGCCGTTPEFVRALAASINR